MSKPVFLNHEIVFNPTGNEFDKARDQLLGTYKLVKIEDWEYKFIKQPKLSIPKKIAELANTGDTEYIRWSFADDFIPGNDFVGIGDDWRDHENREAEIVRRKALVSAYLAGKALGVELVEVEG